VHKIVKVVTDSMFSGTQPYEERTIAQDKERRRLWFVMIDLQMLEAENPTFLEGHWILIGCDRH